MGAGVLRPTHGWFNFGLRIWDLRFRIWKVSARSAKTGTLVEEVNYSLPNFLRGRATCATPF